MRKLALLLAASASALLPSIAFAQEDQAPITLAETAEGHARTLTAPTADSGSGVPRERYALSASTADNVLAVTIAPVAPRFTGSDESALTVTFKAPLGTTLGGSAESTVADQGLANKFSGSVSYSLIHTSFGATGAEAAAVETIMKRCRAALDRQLGRRSTTDEFQAQCNNDASNPFEMSDEDLRARIGSGPGQVSAAMVEAIVGYRERKRTQPLVLLNVTGSVGVRDYSSLNPGDFSDRKTERTSMAFNLTGGVSFGNTGLFLGGGYQYRRDYKDAEKREVCPAGSTTGCRTEIFDLPKADIDNSAFAVLRFRGPQVGIANGTAPIVEVKVAYDFQDKLWGVQIPIYFVTDEEGGLRGGLRFTYESRGNDPNKQTTTFGVFMVKSFDQLGLAF